MKRSVVCIVLALILLLPILFMGALLAIAGEEVTPSDKALEEIPSDLLPIYQAAASTCDGLKWTVLAAIHKLETSFGRGHAVSPKGALGPMQFMPSTWASYALDGNGDGVADIKDVDDAIYAAAFMLCENGAGDPARLTSAIWNYNHSDEYVAQVLELATSYGVATFGLEIANASPSDLLNNPRVTLTANARADLAAGVIDSRIVALLDALARRYTIGVGVFKTGHAVRTRSGSVSNHYFGRAVDISFVNGTPVSSLNRAAELLVTALSQMDAQMRPSEIGHPFSSLMFLGGFSDSDHDGHIHIGFD